MPSPSHNSSAGQDWKPGVSPWLIASAVMLATFMEVLDTSIASVTLPHIAGSLSVYSYVDDLRYMAALCFLCAPIVFFIRRVKPKPGAAPAH
jgi:hypothetical protein